MTKDTSYDTGHRLHIRYLAYLHRGVVFDLVRTSRHAAAPARFSGPRALSRQPSWRFRRIATAFPLTRQMAASRSKDFIAQWVARYTRKMLNKGSLTGDRQALLDQYHRDDLLWLIRGVKSQNPKSSVDLSPNYAWLMPELFTISPAYWRTMNFFRKMATWAYCGVRMGHSVLYRRS